MKRLRILLLLTVIFFHLPSRAQERDSSQQINRAENANSFTLKRNSIGPDTGNAPGAIGTISRPDSYGKETNAVTGGLKKVIPQSNIIENIMRRNKLLNVEAAPQYFVNEIRTENNDSDILFYALCGILLLLGIFKTSYNHYFSNLISVFFNTSLRQTQLSEQLLQAKLPSLILNLFFVLIAGMFVWLLFLNGNTTGKHSPYWILQFSLLAIAAIYIIKLCFLKFLGWISGISEVTNQYIFIIFLVNKLLALVLVPFVILIAFGKKEWISIYITLALLCIGVLFLTRYLKSYGLLRQKNFPMTAFHFLLFFVGGEIVPILIMYKVAVDYLLV